jgi:hypothetical protein
MRIFLFPSIALASVLSLAAAACGSSGGGGSGGTGGTTMGTSSSSSSGTSSTTSGGGTGGLGAGQCRSQSDCGGGDFCSLNVLPPLCGGVCDTGAGGDCQSDAECADAGAGLICGRPCACWLGGAIPQDRCTTGCASNADCGPSLACNASHHCEAATCAAPADCTADFACTSGACAPKPCTADADCGGHCVNSACSPILGTCSPAVP